MLKTVSTLEPFPLSFYSRIFMFSATQSCAIFHFYPFLLLQSGNKMSMNKSDVLWFSAKSHVCEGKVGGYQPVLFIFVLKLELKLLWKQMVW